MTTIIVNQYCKIVKQLVNYYEKHSDHIDRIKHARQARLVINEAPVHVIESTGPELYNRKEHILANDMQSIISTRNDLDANNTDSDTIDIIDAILNVWHSSDDKNKDEIASAIKMLLNLYMKYLLNHA